MGNQSVWVLGGVWSQGCNLKELTEGHHQEWRPAALFDTTLENSPGPNIVRIGRLIDSMGGGAWPFLVGGVNCLVNSVNERDLGLLNSVKYLFFFEYFLEGLCASNARKFKAITGL